MKTFVNISEIPIFLSYSNRFLGLSSHLSAINGSFFEKEVYIGSLQV
jgi:hypothetical protein